MMRRLMLLAGFLLLPASAAAQEALSPWVQEVLVRVDQGVGMAEGLANGTCGDVTTAEIENTLSLVRQLVLPELTREAESQFLREATVCMENDRRMLEEKIRELLEKINEASAGCRFGTVTALRENYAFLMKAYQVFLHGSMNPAFQDDMLRFRYPAQDRDLWDSGAREAVYDQDSTAPLCPFTTDYGPHALGYRPTEFGGAAPAGDDIRSYGCDRTVLESISGPLESEADRLAAFMDRTDELSRSLYDTVAVSLFHIRTILAVIAGDIPPSEAPGSKPPPPHEELTECLRPMMPSDPAETEALLAAYPDYFEPGNYGDHGSYGPASRDNVLPTGLLLRATHDFFLTMPGAGILQRAYMDRRENNGYDRPLPPSLVGNMFDSFFTAIFRDSSTPNQLKNITSNVEREMAYLESMDRDAMQRMRDASVPLEAAVESLVEAVDEYLPNDYIPDLAYFLARSCVDGHCQNTLNAVNKRIRNPYCHPYIDGLYTQDDAHKRCFCDPSLESEDEGFWDRYCSADISEDLDRYNNMPPQLFPGCMEENSVITGPRR